MPPNALHPARSLRERLVEGISLHQGGNVEAALTIYAEVLAEDPRQFDALRLTAAARLARGEPSLALDFFDRALEVRRDIGEVWRLRADALALVGRLQEAADSLEQSLRWEAPIAERWARLGQWRYELRQFAAAQHAAGRLVQLAPQSAAAWFNLALASDAARDPRQALEAYDRGLTLDAGAADAWCGRAKVLKDLGRTAESGASLDRSLALDPNYVPALNSRASLLRDLGDLVGSLQNAESALRLTQASTDSWAQLGCTLTSLGRLHEARDALCRAISLAPDNAQAAYNLGVVRLTLGELPAAWDDYEQRIGVVAQLGAIELPVDPLLGPVPVWQRGQDLSGKRLAVLAEQGLGDTLQFCRYAPLLVARGASVTLVVQPSLAYFLGQQPHLGSDVVVVSAGQPLRRPDLQCSMLSLPHRFATELADLPAALPYLVAPLDVQAAWKSRLLRAGQPARWRVGFACSGNPGHTNDRNRSIALKQFAGLFHLVEESLGAEGVEWHFLQPEVRPSDLPDLDRRGIFDHRAVLEGWTQTAGLLSALDYVICVDTAVAHLAGAMKRPLLLLLPAHSDWRWLKDREDTPWYPQARVIRQTTPGRWEPALERAAQVLVDHRRREGVNATGAGL